MSHQIEIVAIGSELLKGTTVNTNAAEISFALFQQGYHCQQHLVVPDNHEWIKTELQNALKRSNIVITTGGLGPTCDDITKKVAADVFESDFIFNEELAADLKQRYGNLAINLEDQATVPTKASLLKNPFGTAPGIVFHSEIGTLILIPGVPKEMRAMLHDQVLPYLKENFPNSLIPLSRKVHFFGVSESSIDSVLRTLEEQYPEVTFGIYPSYGLLSVYATINTPNQQSIDRLDTIIKTIKEAFLNHHYSDDSEKIEVIVQDLFVKKGWKLCTAESCTGGAIAARLTKIPGAAEYFLGGFITYSYALKEKILNVDKKLLDKEGAVNESTVKTMALEALKKTDCDFSIAVSGVAGPTTGGENEPAGTVWIAVARKNEETLCRKIQGYGNREMIIEQSVNASLGTLLRFADLYPG